MKPIETPVYRPTANCIWNSFLNSNKRHLIITGGRKTGKTTLLSRLFPESLPGITTWAIPENAVYLRENATREAVQIGIFDPSLPGPENRMQPVSEGFEKLGIPALNQCLQAEGEWIFIDEIGYLESGCPEYRKALLNLMDKKRLIAAVRKQPIPFLQEICQRDDAFIVDLDNPFGNVGCVIMASGLGKRFGGNKLMENFQGQPMICRMLAATDGIFARRVVVTRHREIAELCEKMGVSFVLHDLPHRSDTVRLGLETMQGVNACMFCPGDQPMLKQETVASLALAWMNDQSCIWRTAFEDAPGSPVIFPEWAFAELHCLPEGKGGGFVAKKHPDRTRVLPVQDKYELMDVDTPDDLLSILENK